MTNKMSQSSPNLYLAMFFNPQFPNQNLHLLLLLYLANNGERSSVRVCVLKAKLMYWTRSSHVRLSRKGREAGKNQWVILFWECIAM